MLALERIKELEEGLYHGKRASTYEAGKLKWPAETEKAEA